MEKNKVLNYFKNKIRICMTYDFTLNDLIQNNAITNLKFFHDKKNNIIQV